MQFKTQGKLLQLKDDYVKNVAVTNTTTVTKGPSDFESKEYTLNADIELENDWVMVFFSSNEPIKFSEGTLIKFLMFNKDYFENMTFKEFTEFFENVSDFKNKSELKWEFLDALLAMQEEDE